MGNDASDEYLAKIAQNNQNGSNNREMFMKFLQNSKEIHINFEKELLFLRTY